MLGGMNRFRRLCGGLPSRGMRRPGTAATCVLTLAGLVFAAGPAPAQRVDKGSVKEPPGSARVDTAPERSATTDFGSSPVARQEGPPTMASLIDAQPQGWEFYLKGGPVFSLGNGFFEKHMGTGWTVQMGLRQPLIQGAKPWLLFAEFGGGYTANPGRSNRPVTTSGIVFFPNDDHIHPFNDFFDTQLVELQRGFVQGALGMYYYPEFMNKPGERLFHLNTRFGLRGGGMRTVYNQQIQLGLRTAFEAHAGPNGHGHNPALVQFFPDAKEPELFFAMFGSFGAGVTLFDATLFGRKIPDITFGAEIEFCHEWFNAGAYGHNDPGFGSYTPMLTLAFSF